MSFYVSSEPKLKHFRRVPSHISVHKGIKALKEAAKYNVTTSTCTLSAELAVPIALSLSDLDYIQK